MPQTYEIDHAVTIVGYESGVDMPNGEKWDVWIVKNSWCAALRCACFA